MIEGQYTTKTKNPLRVIKISQLKVCGLFDGIESSVAKWPDGFEIQISIELKDPGLKTIEIQDYGRTQTLSITSIQSNLGIGEIWLFKCPKSGRSCRNIVLIDSHWQSISKGLYLIKSVTKKNRTHVQKFKRNQNELNLFNRLNGRKGTKYYSGRPTRAMKKFEKMINIK